MISINENEGLLEYVRRMEKMNNEITLVSGIPVSKLSMKQQKQSIHIIGNEDFITKFLEALPDDCKSLTR